jgi:formate-dependent nitrite reductase membrane component NrfD
MSPRNGRGGRGGRGERAMVPPAEFRTYYDRPVLKKPVWKHWIPAYMFVGGLAAGSSLLAEALAWSGDRSAARRARHTSLVAIAAGMGFLVVDLGRQDRFHHMLRVFRPSSPMNMGTWLLTAYAPAVGAAALADDIGLAGVARVGGVVAAGLAPAIATYTGVLVADTAVPVWHDAYRELPYVFAAGAAASAGAAAVLVAPRAQVPAAAVRFALVGAVAEVGTVVAMRSRLGALVGEVYQQGEAGRFENAARTATVAGGALMTRRGTRRFGAALVFAGAALQRFAITAAGTQSASDPKYVVVPQRERLEGVHRPG